MLLNLTSLLKTPIERFLVFGFKGGQSDQVTVFYLTLWMPLGPSGQHQEAALRRGGAVRVLGHVHVLPLLLLLLFRHRQARQKVQVGRIKRQMRARGDMNLNFFNPRAKPVYIGGQLVYSLGMVFMAATQTKWGVLFFSWSAGVMYSTLFTMPYLLVAHYHETDTVRPCRIDFSAIQMNKEEKLKID